MRCRQLTRSLALMCLILRFASAIAAAGCAATHGPDADPTDAALTQAPAGTYIVKGKDLDVLSWVRAQGTGSVLRAATTISRAAVAAATVGGRGAARE